MFHIKICGVRRPEDVRAAAESGADAIGLNFFSGSIRYSDPESPATGELSRLASSAGLTRVGVFVTEPVDSIARIADEIGLDAVQLHGDEEAGIVAKIRAATGLPIIRAIKLPTGELGAATISERTGRWIDTQCHLLFDADAGAQHGGSGNKLDWPSIRDWAEQHPTVRWTLAGGLTPENIAEAIRQSGAKSVDTASGVEEPKGRKSETLIEQFVANSKRT